MLYPPKVTAKLARLDHACSDGGVDAIGTEVNFSCGSFIRFLLSVDMKASSVAGARFVSNGCGFMLAAAEVLAQTIENGTLADLRGLTPAFLYQDIELSLGEIPIGRHECARACIEALRAAFADHRMRQIEEFRGERALICTCFGVTEETIEAEIERRALMTIDDVTAVCRAGGGCGSCRMLIQEMLDAQ